MLLLDRLPPDLRQRVLQCRSWELAHGRLLGKILLSTALTTMQRRASLEDLRYTPEGKPWLHGGPHFNISHSANRVVCAISDEGPIGVDIEKIKHRAVETFEPQFTTEEWAVIRHSSNPNAQLYQLWTAKESIMKADGRGLDIPLQQVDVSAGSLEGSSWSLRSLSDFDGYACHIAIEGMVPPNIVVTSLTIQELIEHYRRKE